MDLSGPSEPAPRETPAPANGLKLMLLALVVFLLLLGYGLWERSRLSQVQTSKITLEHNVSP